MKDLDLKVRLLARYRSQEPTWQIDEYAYFKGDAVSTFASVKTAAFPPPPQEEGLPPPPEKEGGGGGKRNIPKDHPYDPKTLKPLAKALWAASVSLGHALTAYRHLSSLKSASISPDGMLGGRGYVMNVTDVRQKLQNACEGLSAITDTLHDEVNAPHWKPRLAELDENEAEDVQNFVQESEGLLENPGEEADEEAQEIEKRNDGDDEEEDDEEKDEDEEEDDEDEGSSELPSGGNASADLSEKSSSPGFQQREARVANSSLPVETLPGGPRVEHLDREDGPPEACPPTSDDWGIPSAREYAFPTPWENDFSDRGAQSAVPDSSSEDTPTEAWDFGLGYGARGQGAGGYENPTSDGKGVWGPSSGLPGSPPQSSGDTTPKIDVSLNDRHSQGLLPGDKDVPVARSDYYRGDRGNLVNTQSRLPGESAPCGELAPSMMNTDYVTEDVSTPYVRYDYTTHQHRPPTGMSTDG